MILNKILKAKKTIIEQQKKRVSQDFFMKKGESIKRKSLCRQLAKKEFGIIAEVKKASPSAGIIKKRYMPDKLAVIYEKSGVSGISVLTCEPFFLGSIRHLVKVKKSVNLPVLRKDFVIDEYQLFEAGYYGADCVLLIACLLSLEKMRRFIDICEELNLESIIEIHDSDDAEKIKSIKNWKNKILGINNRNLKTLSVDINTTLHLINKVQRDKMLVISESGIRSFDDIEKVRKCGVNGVLVGEALLKSSDAAKKIKELSPQNKI